MSNEINKLLSAWEDRRLNREGQAKLLGLMVDVMNGNRDEIDRLTQQLEAVEREREIIGLLRMPLSRALHDAWDEWETKEYNQKWVKKIAGTPIRNDLIQIMLMNLVCIDVESVLLRQQPQRDEETTHE